MVIVSGLDISGILIYNKKRPKVHPRFTQMR